MKAQTDNPATRRRFLQLAGGVAVTSVLGRSTAFAARPAERPAPATADPAQVETKIRALRENKYSCSQATFLGICTTFGGSLTEEQLIALSAGFAGGIGRTYNDGTCGALAAGVMAAGFYLPGQAEQAITIAKELFEQFKKREGTVICKDILKKYGGFGNCTNCCLNVGHDVAEMVRNLNA